MSLGSPNRKRLPPRHAARFRHCGGTREPIEPATCRNCAAIAFFQNGESIAPLVPAYTYLTFCILHFSFLLFQWLCPSEFNATAIDEAILKALMTVDDCR